MIYLLDIGNTHCRLANYHLENDEIDLLEIFPTSLFQEKINFHPIGDKDLIFIASVVPLMTQWLKDNYIHCSLFFISPELLPEIDFSHVNAQQIGADRLANVAAACKFDLLPAIIFDCGTAITCEIINQDRVFIGGAIMPGRQLLRQSLQQYTAQLPLVSLDFPAFYPNAWGTTTEQAIVCGTEAEALGGIQYLITQIHEFLPRGKVLITGGDAHFFAKLPQAKKAPDLFTLQGLSFLAQKQLSKLS